MKSNTVLSFQLFSFKFYEAFILYRKSFSSLFMEDFTLISYSQQLFAVFINDQYSLDFSKYMYIEVVSWKVWRKDRGEFENLFANSSHNLRRKTALSRVKLAREKKNICLHQFDEIPRYCQAIGWILSVQFLNFGCQFRLHSYEADNFLKKTANFHIKFKLDFINSTLMVRGLYLLKSLWILGYINDSQGLWSFHQRFGDVYWYYLMIFSAICWRQISSSVVFIGIHNFPLLIYDAADLSFWDSCDLLLDIEYSKKHSKYLQNLRVPIHRSYDQILQGLDSSPLVEVTIMWILLNFFPHAIQNYWYRYFGACSGNYP